MFQKDSIVDGYTDQRTLCYKVDDGKLWKVNAVNQVFKNHL